MFRHTIATFSRHTDCCFLFFLYSLYSVAEYLNWIKSNTMPINILIHAHCFQNESNILKYKSLSVNGLFKSFILKILLKSLPAEYLWHLYSFSQNVHWWCQNYNVCMYFQWIESVILWCQGLERQNRLPSFKHLHI